MHDRSIPSAETSQFVSGIGFFKFFLESALKLSWDKSIYSLYHIAIIHI